MRTIIFALLMLPITTLFANETPAHPTLRPLKIYQKPPTDYQSTHLPLTKLTAHKHIHYAFHPGSLRDNIIKLARDFGWSHVVWQPQYDYHWVGSTQFSQTNLKNILGKVLHDFPLQAVFYEGNHILVITPRNIQ